MWGPLCQAELHDMKVWIWQRRLPCPALHSTQIYPPILSGINATPAAFSLTIAVSYSGTAAVQEISPYNLHWMYLMAHLWHQHMWYTLTSRAGGLRIESGDNKKKQEQKTIDTNVQEYQWLECIWPGPSTVQTGPWCTDIYMFLSDYLGRVAFGLCF